MLGPLLGPLLINYVLADSFHGGRARHGQLLRWSVTTPLQLSACEQPQRLKSLLHREGEDGVRCAHSLQAIRSGRQCLGLWVVSHFSARQQVQVVHMQVAVQVTARCFHAIHCGEVADCWGFRATVCPNYKHHTLKALQL